MQPHHRDHAAGRRSAGAQTEWAIAGGQVAFRRGNASGEFRVGVVAAAGLTPVNQPFTHLLDMPYMASSRFEVPFMACCEVRYAVQKNRTNAQDNRAESFHGTASQIDQCAVDVGVHRLFGAHHFQA